MVSKTFQELLKDSSAIFKDYKLMKNPNLHIKNSTSKMLDRDHEVIIIRKLV